MFGLEGQKRPIQSNLNASSSQALRWNTYPVPEPVSSAVPAAHCRGGKRLQ